MTGFTWLESGKEEWRALLETEMSGRLDCRLALTSLESTPDIAPPSFSANESP